MTAHAKELRHKICPHINIRYTGKIFVTPRDRKRVTFSDNQKINDNMSGSR